MAVTAKRIYKGTPGIVSSTAYTVPALTTTIVKNIILTNKTAIDATITITVSDIEVVYQYNVAAKDTVSLDISIVMLAAETILVVSGTADSINVYMSGVEVA